MAKDTFSTPEVARFFDINLNRLNNWLNSRLIVPSIEKASGHGSKNVFSFIDLCRISLFMKLINIGLSREAASEIVNSAVKDLPQTQLTLAPFTPHRYTDRSWILIRKAIVSGKEQVSAQLIEHWQYEDGYTSVHKSDFFDEISAMLKNSEFLFIIDLTHINNQVNDRLISLYG